jgi:transposase-like protein
VRLVVGEQGPDESRKAACERLAPRLNVNPTTLYGWVKQAVPRRAAAHAPGSLEELRAANAQLRKRTVSWPARMRSCSGCVFLRGGARAPVEEIAAFVIAHRGRRTEGLR